MAKFIKTAPPRYNVYESWRRALTFFLALNASLRAEPAVVIGSFADAPMQIKMKQRRLEACVAGARYPHRDLRGRRGVAASRGSSASGFISDAGTAAGSVRAGVCRRLGCRRDDRRGRILSLSGTAFRHPVTGYLEYPSFGGDWAGDAAALS